MKTVILILMTMSLKAFASQVECTQALKSYNNKYDGKSEIVLIDFKESGSFIFIRSTKEKSDERSAEGIKAVRTCLQAGVPNTFYLGDYGNDLQKTSCQIQNLNTMAAYCEKMTPSTRKLKIVKLK